RHHRGRSALVRCREPAWYRRRRPGGCHRARPRTRASLWRTSRKMTAALSFLVDSLLSIYIYALILRFVMQLVRADFRNPFAHFIVGVTNPVTLPLRRILPPLGKVDTASVLVILLVTAAKIAILSLIAGNRVLDPFAFAAVLLFDLVMTFIRFFTGAILVYA